MAVEISEDMRDVLLSVFDDRAKLLGALAPDWSVAELNRAIEQLRSALGEAGLSSPEIPPRIPEPLDAVQRECLRWAIENNDYLNPHADYQPELLSYYRGVVRGLAEILEGMGVEISRLSAGEPGITHYPSVKELEQERREVLRQKLGLE